MERAVQLPLLRELCCGKRIVRQEWIGCDCGPKETEEEFWCINLPVYICGSTLPGVDGQQITINELFEYHCDRQSCVKFTGSTDHDCVKGRGAKITRSTLCTYDPGTMPVVLHLDFQNPGPPAEGDAAPPNYVLDVAGTNIIGRLRIGARS